MQNKITLPERFLRWRRERREQARQEKLEDKSIKMLKSHRAILWTVFAIFMLYAVTLIFPFVWMLFNSVKTKQEFFFDPWAAPEKIMISNYWDIFDIFPIGEMFFNSFMLVLFCPIAGVFVVCCAAYAVSKYRFKGRQIIYFIAITIMFIPTTGSVAVTYKLMYDLHLMDTLPGMVIMHAGGFGFNFLVMYGTFSNISWSYGEAARVDGAGNWRIFFQIMLPHAMPTIAAIWVLAIIGTWNDYTGPLMFYSSHQTVATGLKYLSDNITAGDYVLDYPRLFAAIMISTLPIFILFIACQKYIIKLNMGGGLKG